MISTEIILKTKYFKSSTSYLIDRAHPKHFSQLHKSRLFERRGQDICNLNFTFIEHHINCTIAAKITQKMLSNINMFTPNMQN